MVKTYKEYNERKTAFFEKHDYDFHTETSSMDQYGNYTKTYNFADGAQWFESMSPEYIEVEQETEVRKCKVLLKQSVKMLRTEYWSTDDSTTEKYYERF